jgi:molybdopterin/thiamine biosynthesis adenylyltransferase
MRERYSRQTILPEIVEAGQQKLGSSHIAIVGCGGLGAIAAAYLAGVGVGHMSLIDGDIPDVSNLHRQVF